MYWTSFKVIGHSSKNLGPSQKHLAPPGDPSWLRAWSRRLGGSQIEGCQEGLHLLKYQKLSATIVVCHTWEVIFCSPIIGYFCWSNYAIFQGKNTDWKRFISLIQKRSETGPKQWALFFTSYTDLVYLQNLFKRV